MRGEDAPEAGDVAFLTRLAGLRWLTLDKAFSLFHVHHLQGLQAIVLRSSSGLDLNPLSSLPELRELCLTGGVERAALNVQHLTQLTLLAAAAGQDWEEIEQLSRLQQLTLFADCGAHSLALLQQLTCLSLGTRDWPRLAVSPLFWSAQQLPALNALRLWMLPGARLLQAVPTPLTGLHQLAALHLSFSKQSFPAGMQDLSMLPALRTLSLVLFRGEPVIVSPSVTCLNLEGFLPAQGYQPMPDLTGCARLQHIMLLLEQGLVVIARDRLPSRGVTLSVQQSGGRLAVEAGLGVVVRFVEEVHWEKDPETLELVL